MKTLLFHEIDQINERRSKRMILNTVKKIRHTHKKYLNSKVGNSQGQQRLCLLPCALKLTYESLKSIFKDRCHYCVKSFSLKFEFIGLLSINATQPANNKVGLLDNKDFKIGAILVLQMLPHITNVPGGWTQQHAVFY